MYIPIDNKTEQALIAEALRQRRTRLDQPTKTVLEQARESARHDLIVSLMTQTPGQTR